jgi:hypothetical protein
MGSCCVKDTSIFDPLIANENTSRYVTETLVYRWDPVENKFKIINYHV